MNCNLLLEKRTLEKASKNADSVNPLKKHKKCVRSIKNYTFLYMFQIDDDFWESQFRDKNVSFSVRAP